MLANLFCDTKVIICSQALVTAAELGSATVMSVFIRTAPGGLSVRVVSYRRQKFAEAV